MDSPGIAQQANLAASRNNIPLSVFAEVTHACNLRCYHCYQHDHSRTRELPLSRWEGLLSELSGAGALYIAFSGGEVFMRPDFCNIVASARGHGFAVSIITNGTLLDKKTVFLLASMGVMDVGVSFHAAGAALHDRLSGVKGSYAKALRAVRLCAENGIRVVIKHCVSKENFGQYAHLQDMAQREGWLFEGDSTVLPKRDGQVSPYALSAGQHEIFLRDMGMRPLQSCADTKNTWALHCDAGRSLCGITPRGDIVPCVLMPIRFGNVLRRPFADVWNGMAASRFRLREETLEAVCEQCSMQSACSRCHAVAYRETGQWRGKSRSLCERARAMQSVGADVAVGSIGQAGEVR